MRYFLLVFGFFLFFGSCQRGNHNTEQAAYDTPVSTTEVVARFAPLAENERFAFTQRNVPRVPVGNAWNYTLYVVRNNDITDITELFTFEDADMAPQFTSDLRTAFILTYGRSATPPPPPNNPNPFLMIDGNAGEIRRLPGGAWRGGMDNRVSKDGRFTAFLIARDALNYRDQVNIFVFDIETETRRQFTWHINSPLQGDWRIFRFENVFRIYANDGGYIVAVAELDPTAMELRTLWDRTNENHGWRLPRIGGEWSDDVSRQHLNPTVRLRHLEN